MMTFVWNLTLASIVSGYTSQASLSNSSESMHIIVFNVAEPTTYLCMMSALIGKSGLVTMCINSLKYESSSSETCFFVFAWGESRKWWDHMCAHQNMHTLLYTCMGSLYTSDEVRELFIVLDLTSNRCLQLDYTVLHHLRQVKWGSLVSHRPCLHVINSNIHVW